MGLASALNTALTGLTAAETTIDVVGNNLANSNTVGFKASRASFATQFLQTHSLGSAPTASDGGTNPRQVGLGTMVAGITPNFSQGTISLSSNSTDMAIEGSGFFIVQASGGEHLYTRDGEFTLNSENQMVTATGNRLLGYGVNNQFEVQTTQLVPLTIPLGSAAVAQATENVYLEGTLTPTGDIATTAQIIQSGILGDAAYTAPNIVTAGTSAQQSQVPANTTTWALSASGDPPATPHLDPAGTYRYRVVFADGAIGSNFPTESTASVSIGPISMAGNDTVTLNTIPKDTTGSYSRRRVYRTDATGTGDYYLVAEIPDNTTTTLVDSKPDSALGAKLDTTVLTGNYSYYVTFADQPGGPGFGNESRPTPLIGPVNITNGRVQIKNLPVDTSGQWHYMRIYRNTAADEGTYRFVTEIGTATTSGSFTDTFADSTIPGHDTIDLDGPIINTRTLLTDVLRRDGSTYSNVFEVGTLSFTGRKGDQSLSTKQFAITSTSTVGDLLTFMEDALGIQKPPGSDPLHPIPTDSSGAPAGGSVTGDPTNSGRLCFVSNNGTANAVDINLSGLQLTTAAGTANVNLPFSTTQTAIGESASADVIVYDSLGIPLSVRITAVLESRTSTATTYRWFADCADNDPLTGSRIAVGTGLISFDGEGNFLSATNNTVSVDRSHISSASPLEFDLDLSDISGLAADSSSLAVSRQDGSAPGTLTSYIMGEDGNLTGVFSNGITRSLGQIRLANFANPSGLQQQGQNLYSAGVNSGLPIEGNPGERGIGTIVAGSVELSNTDIGSNLIDLILASTMYRGNTRVITTSQQMLDELLAVRR